MHHFEVNGSFSLFFSVAHAFKFVSIDMVLHYTNAFVLELWSLIKIIAHRSRVIDLLNLQYMYAQRGSIAKKCSN